MDYKTVYSADETGNRVAELVRVPIADVESNGWDCCADEVQPAGEQIPDGERWVPMAHWLEVHEYPSLTDDELHHLLGVPGFKAGTAMPEHSTFDGQQVLERRQLAEAELARRGLRT